MHSPHFPAAYNYIHSKDFPRKKQAFTELLNNIARNMIFFNKVQRCVYILGSRLRRLLPIITTSIHR